MQFHLDEHGILEISHDDRANETWSNYQVMLNKKQLAELRDLIDNKIMWV